MKLSDEEMYRALVNKDSSYEGTFITGVKTTGIFCRPSCTARKPKRENVEFFATTKEALENGYRPCKVCHPLEPLGEVPNYIQDLLDEIESDPTKKITDGDLIERGMSPSHVRRWFKKNHGISFQAYQRMIRINGAFTNIMSGKGVTDSAFDSGYNSLSGFNSAYKNLIGDTPSGKNKNVITVMRFTSVLGPMIAASTDKGICLLEFSDRRMLETELKDIRRIFKSELLYGENDLLRQVKREIEEYFAGTRQAFDVPLDVVGSDFQKQVWAQLQTIPYGTTRSYAEQAAAMNNPKAVRAVGTANGHNRIAIIIPCHRVIGSNGKLTGYGGGLWRKQWLLDLEMKNV
ncbi:bifunctional transcriptional activator/DNA repair enzyme AdaA [Culicoidibacter larvae]|uniref:Methylated-DNA--protein-cysteine methyltransferase n=1 Tax=Culicoidibacter larvae TaxID=2579976 RepID=A0A5R8QFQ9_9FIRM|nr:methylated-DNA--[protein]-cysteine S-methyltransferase [Culicoidibacter larvae]TLG76812.1 methylated-DNA--[protein]-cysteine S-methyltransferase [Culicoidibacter larvae]